MTDSLGHVCVLSYDENELLLGETDPAGNITRYAYDAKTRLTYTGIGELAARTNPDGS